MAATYKLRRSFAERHGVLPDSSVTSSRTSSRHDRRMNDDRRPSGPRGTVDRRRELLSKFNDKRSGGNRGASDPHRGVSMNNTCNKGQQWSKERNPIVRPLSAPGLRHDTRAQMLETLGGRGGFNSSLYKVKSRKQGAPPSAGAFRPRNPRITHFKRCYDHGDIPISVVHSAQRFIRWKVDLHQLDFWKYLPIFFDGLRETEEPYVFLAEKGCVELLYASKGDDRILQCVPLLVTPIKHNFDTRNRAIMLRQLVALRTLIQCNPRTAQCMLPYFRQILYICNLFVTKRVNCGDAFDYSNPSTNMTELIMEVLHLLEKHGGPRSFDCIKKIVPTYERST